MAYGAIRVAQHVRAMALSTRGPFSLSRQISLRSTALRLPSRTSEPPKPFAVFRDVPPLRDLRRQMFREGRQVGLVPTMGALHEGHLSLVRHALQENDDVFVSIFVNPTQFAVHEDLDSYPQTWEEDLKKLRQVQDEYSASGSGKKATIKGVFAPTVKVMYPTLPPSSDIAGDGSFVTITPLGRVLEGASRPIFFRGVATVCTKLFNIVQPDRVYFGQKDIQQCILIKRMVKDFHIPTEVRVIPTSREPDGLAMSSRNVYLGERRRKDVVVLSKALFAAQELYNNGEVYSHKIRGAANDLFDKEVQNSSCRLSIDYVALSHPESMAMMRDGLKVDPKVGAVLSAAMVVDPVTGPMNEEEKSERRVRLIDNVILEPRPRQPRGKGALGAVGENSSPTVDAEVDSTEHRAPSSEKNAAEMAEEVDEVEANKDMDESKPLGGMGAS